tara:strand:+ start:1870 stop:2037 length:168 start_codon:yes stop_codon:yes gene_type:complete
MKDIMGNENAIKIKKTTSPDPIISATFFFIMILATIETTIPTNTRVIEFTKMEYR